jgi:3-phenylpropionate/cinnamic acid dioxygenase small subunit
MAGPFEDKFAIQELIARYNHAIDFGNYDAWVECFAEDGVFEGLSVAKRSRRAQDRLRRSSRLFA